MTATAKSPGREGYTEQGGTVESHWLSLCRHSVAVVIFVAESLVEALTASKMNELKSEWTDQFVKVKPERPELKRFDGLIGRVVTVNWNGKAIVDFADGAWYDIAASETFLTKVPAEEAKGKYDATANSSQKLPARQA